MKRVKKPFGFNLVELMITVSIVGMVAAMAVPRYGQMVAKSRQAEAKDGLGHIYTREFIFQKEWNQYYADFRDLGVRFSGILTYRMGFSGPGVNAPNVSHYSLPDGSAQNAAAVRYDSTRWIADTGPLGGSTRARENTATVCAITGTSLTTATTFLASACGNIDSDTTRDRWTIDQEKLLLNTANDLVL